MARRFLFVVLVALGAVAAPVQAETPLPPAQFTALFAEAVRKTMPSAKVEITAELSLRVEFPNGRVATPNLGNAYAAYEQDPAGRDRIIALYVERAVANLSGDNPKIDTTRVIPVVRSRRFGPIAAAEKNPASDDAIVFDPFGDEFVIIYAEDRPQDLRFFTAKYFKQAGIERLRLRALAIENLRRIVGAIEYKDYGGTYMLIADGTNEASLLLLPELWTNGKLNVDGDHVVALPTRDLLIVTGSNDTRGISGVRALAENAFAKGPYSISPKLFRFRDGRLTPF